MVEAQITSPPRRRGRLKCPCRRFGLYAIIMSTTRINPAPPLPRWVILLGSGIIAFHFFAIGAYVLSAPSGPWPVVPFGSSPALAPFFLKDPTRPPNDYNVRENYLRLLHMDHDYHFQANHTDLSAVVFEARLLDKDKKEITTLTFPQKKVNFWVRHRQALLAQGLGEDRPVEGSRGNPIAAPGQRSREVEIWEPLKINSPHFVLKKKANITSSEELSGPSARALLLAKAYVRYLGRTQKAAYVELIRRSRNPVLPDMVFTHKQLRDQGKDPIYDLTEMNANFGVEEVPDEK